MKNRGRNILSFVLAACLALTLVVPGASAAPAETSEAWRRTEPGGAYVTTRVYCPGWEEMDWAETQKLAVRYADTKEPVALTSEFYQGWLFATVPANQADRPLEAFSGEPAQFADAFTRWDGHEAYDPPMGTDELNLRGLLNGDGSGNLNASHVLSRAEAFALAVRMLSLQPAGDPGFADVKQGDWYHDIASASRAAGLAAAAETFRPGDMVTRGEMTVLLYRALKAIGWISAPEGTVEDLDLVDAEQIPDWALEAYLALQKKNIPVVDEIETGELDGEGIPKTVPRANWSVPCTREDAILMVYEAQRYVPWYPTQLAIDWGFDREMPVIDGSTSTLPYSQAVYGALFYNSTSHPQYPEKNSKSFYSYDRLIRGEADILFASTNPTEDTVKKAEEAGVTLEQTPMALDGMVFFTNSDNPVDNLTMEQIRKIYVENAYDNWNQLGGPDATFVPYCRNRDSGSQAQMEQFFLGDQEIHPDILRETTSTSMQSVLTDVWNAGKPAAEGPGGTTVPPTWALGYSIYYYYQGASMILLPDNVLKLLKVEGVLPDDQTLADGSYPLAGYNYTVVRGDSPENSLARRMAAFMLSEEGQNCVSNAGFGRLPEKADPSA